MAQMGAENSRLKDCLRAKAILRTAMADNNEFYRTYKEVMKQLGKV